MYLNLIPVADVSVLNYGMLEGGTAPVKKKLVKIVAFLFRGEYFYVIHVSIWKRKIECIFRDIIPVKNVNVHNMKITTVKYVTNITFIPAIGQKGVIAKQTKELLK